MAFNWNRALGTTNRQITRFGANALLRRVVNGSNQDRACVAAVLEYSPRNRALVTEGASRVLISAQNLTIPPDEELDRLIWKGAAYRFPKPIRGIRPAGIVLFYDGEVVYDTSNV